MPGEVHRGVRSHDTAVEPSLRALERRDYAPTGQGEGTRLLRRQVPYERLLEESRKEGLTVKQRAHNLDISASTYNRYLNAYGLPRHGRNIRYKFTDEELRRRIDDGQSCKRMAEELHVECVTVRRRTHRLGLKAARHPTHYKLSDQALMELHGMNITVTEAAGLADPQVSPHTVKRGWERLALPPHFRGRRRNTSDEEYRELHAKGHTISEIADIRHEHHDTTERNCRELGLRPNRRSKYDLHEQLLRELHARRLTEKEAAVEAGLPAEAYTVVGRRWKDLGLAPHFYATKRKTPDEEYIRLYSSGYTISEIARIRHEDYETARRNCRNLEVLLHARWQVQQAVEVAARGQTPMPRSVSMTEAALLIRNYNNTRISDRKAWEAYMRAVEDGLPAGEVIRILNLRITPWGLIQRWHKLHLVFPYSQEDRAKKGNAVAEQVH
jgi:DNA-binding CsgD family transcriptional regulator